MPLSVQQAATTRPERPKRTPLRPEDHRAFKAEENRRSFLRVVSHELRTPLNAIIGFSEIIARELYGPLSEPRYREHAEIVRDSGMKLLKLVNDVLEIARLEAGVSDLDLQPEDPILIAEKAMRSLAAEAEKRGVKLQLSGLAGTALVLADARGLSTIFLNLLQNAITYSPDGGVVEVSAEVDGAQVVLAVRDHGEGVAPDHLARILKPFEQAENALVRRSEGAGLGLSIVGLLCRAMDGRLSLHSTVGEGLTAVVRLPGVGKLAAV